MSGPQQSNPKNKRVAYTVVERSEGKSYWLRVGTAFENRDGSLNVYLDAIPVNGRLQIREYPPDDASAGGGGNGSGDRGGANSNGERGGTRKPFNARG